MAQGHCNNASMTKFISSMVTASDALAHVLMVTASGALVRIKRCSAANHVMHHCPQACSKGKTLDT